MYIKTLKINNWRSIKNAEVTLNEIMLLIGQNNHGKSNILSAFLFFFGEIKPEILDYHKGSNSLYVEATFTELNAQDKITFKKYLASDFSLTVRKTSSNENGIQYSGYCELPDDDWLLEENASKYTTRESIQWVPLQSYIPETGRISRQMILDAQTKYIEDNFSKITYTRKLEAGAFLGQKNIAKGIFGEVFYIPSVRNASDELSAKNNSVFSQIYSKILSNFSQKNEEYNNAKEKMINLVQRLNKKLLDGSDNMERPEELRSFENDLDEEMKFWETKIDVEISPPDIDDALRTSTTVWVDDGFRTDINRKGHGLQRSLIFGLIKVLAKSKLMDIQDNDLTPRQSSKSSFFIIEEPELYLHPQAQRQAFDSLRKLAGINSQVILCTHSSTFLDLNLYKSICIVKKMSDEEGTKCFQNTTDLFIDSDERDKFNIAYWINPDRAELFFAKKVILVEGPTDKTIIPFLAEKLNIFRHDYTIIDCSSKDSMPTYIKLLNAFKIPYIVIFDKDHQADKTKQAKEQADRISNKIISSIDSSLGKSIVFINDIEEEIGVSKDSNTGKPLAALKHVSNINYSINESIMEKIKIIYN